MMYVIRYRRIRVKVDGEKPTVCQCCDKVPKGHLQGHHTKYEFKTDEVRKNPELAKKNVLWLCYYCHKIADAIRKIEENRERAEKIQALMGENNVSKE